MTLADHISAEATLAYALITPCLGALLGLIIAGVSDLIARRKAARVRAAKWKGVVS
jgi:hypothetical protein